jgi:hypothetical protein
MMAGLPMPASGPGGNTAKTDLQGKIDEFYKKTQDLSKQYDPNRLYEEMKAPIESNFYQGANQVSSYLARQGLGSSGMNLAGHAQLEQNRSALESQAQKQAIDQSIQGQLSTELAGLGPELQKYGIDTSQIIAQMQTNAMMEMMNQQMQASMFGGLGSLVGQLGGAAILGGALSDRRLKKNIVYFKQEAVPGVRFAMWDWKVGGSGFGVIAQDLELVRPDLVTVGNDGYRRVNYLGLF